MWKLFARRTPRQKLIDEIVKLINTNEKQAISNRESGEALLNESRLDAARAKRMRKDLEELRALEAIDNPPKPVVVKAEINWKDGVVPGNRFEAAAMKPYNVGTVA